MFEVFQCNSKHQLLFQETFKTLYHLIEMEPEIYIKANSDATILFLGVER